MPGEPKDLPAVLPATAGGAIAVLDPSTLEGLRMLEAATGTALLADLTRTFREDTPKRIAGIREALRTGDCEAIRRVAHSLRGSAGALGAMQLFSAATELERAAEHEAPAGCHHLVDRLEEHAARAFAALERELAQPPSST